MQSYLHYCAGSGAHAKQDDIPATAAAALRPPSSAAASAGDPATSDAARGAAPGARERPGQLLLAAVRRSSAWAYLSGPGCGGGAAGGGTLVYAYRGAAQPGACVAFWDARSGERRVRTVAGLLAMQARPRASARGHV
jgi:hypothetical protein